MLTSDATDFDARCSAGVDRELEHGRMAIALRASAPSAQGHGGQRRSFQFDELLAQYHVRVQTYVTEPFTLRLKELPQAISFYWRHKSRMELSPMSFGKCWRHVSRLQQIFTNGTTLPLLLWENTLNPVSLLLAKERGFRIIGMPQNIESLAPTTLRGGGTKAMLRSFNRDLRYLRLCDEVVTISAEEHWLLAQFGIRSTYLPYLPPESAAAELATIRQDRQTNDKTSYLILGTVWNLPTAEGMIELLEILESLQLTGITFEIAGFGTDKLKVPDSSIFITHGAVTAQKLNVLMTETRAAIVYQVRGCGALTRIVELVGAGVPVIANRVAARSTSDYSGICVFDTREELRQILSSPSLPVPALPKYRELRKAQADTFFNLCFTEVRKRAS